MNLKNNIKWLELTINFMIKIIELYKVIFIFLSINNILPPSKHLSASWYVGGGGGGGIFKENEGLLPITSITLSSSS